jgi:hypothetical protein
MLMSLIKKKKLQYVTLLMPCNQIAYTSPVQQAKVTSTLRHRCKCRDLSKPVLFPSLFVSRFYFSFLYLKPAIVRSWVLFLFIIFINQFLALLPMIYGYDEGPSHFDKWMLLLGLNKCMSPLMTLGHQYVTNRKLINV